jgi:hypothetical protein
VPPLPTESAAGFTNGSFSKAKVYGGFAHNDSGRNVELLQLRIDFPDFDPRIHFGALRRRFPLG